MELSDLICKTENVSLKTEGLGGCSRTQYIFNGSKQEDKENSVFAVLSVDELISSLINRESAAGECHSQDFYFYGGGWQSWGFGGETEPGKYQEKYSGAIPQWKQYIAFPGKAPSKVLGKNPESGKLLKGEFVIYLRWNDVYLAVCSTATVGSDKATAPVKFYVDRKSRRIAAVLYSDGKTWQKDEKAAELTVFAAYSFFALRDAMKEIFAADRNQRFGELEFLNTSSDKLLTGGWESWYNHYADINQKLIDEDLEGLGKTENLIKKEFIDKNHPAVFQVDDGWEIGLGEWENNKERFPEGMTKLASSIAEKGYIPGLWCAPFIIDWRTQFAKDHRDWILRDKKGKPIPAGFGQLWGDCFGKEQPCFPYSYFCFDLSRDDVVEYLDGLMDKIINIWGFRYIKLDFLFAGMIRGNFLNGGCGWEWYDRAIKVLTKRKVNNKGEKVAYLGCGLPFEASYKDFPLSRIGPDTKEAWDTDLLKKMKWSGRPGALVSMYSTLGHSFWDQAVYINDPDVVFLRNVNITLTETEKEMLAMVNYLFASQIMHSDDPVNFDPVDEGRFTKHICSLYDRFRGEEFGMVNTSRDTYIIFNRKGTMAGFVNLSDRPQNFSKKLMGRYLSASSVSVKPSAITEHAEDEGTAWRAEPHSISIYEY